MNETGTNSGGWQACDLRRVLNTEILESLPNSLQRVITPRMIGGAKDKLWLLSKREIFGDEKWVKSYDDHGEQLPYYKRKGNRVKGLGKDGSANHWWERSPHASYATSFCAVGRVGGAGTSPASFSRGVCFGFCI